MNTSTQNNKSAQSMHLDEMILVVPRANIFHTGVWQGLKETNFEEYLSIIQAHKQFLPRSEMETNPTYKQIIPYLIFEHNDTYFLMQRQAKASEQRLKNKYSLGIGGHIRQEDLQNSETIFDWAKREFHEEVDYKGELKITPLGILNDDSDDVGKVHLGFVLLLHGTTNKIAVKSELKSGALYSLDECAKFEESMETWSQVVFRELLKAQR